MEKFNQFLALLRQYEEQHSLYCGLWCFSDGECSIFIIDKMTNVIVADDFDDLYMKLVKCVELRSKHYPSDAEWMRML